MKVRSIDCGKMLVTGLDLGVGDQDLVYMLSNFLFWLRFVDADADAVRFWKVSSDKKRVVSYGISTCLVLPCRMYKEDIFIDIT